MQRRKFIAGLASTAAAGAAGIGTGAFSSVTANRDVDLRVANDNNAYLRLNPTSEYTFLENGKLAFDFTGDNQTSGGGSGLNGTADTEIEDAFTIENQGTQPVYVWIASYDYSAAGNRSVEMVAKGKDLTYPDSETKPADQTISGDNSVKPGGYIYLEEGDTVDVDMIFHVGGGGPREWEDKTWQFRADEDTPDSASDWTDSSLPSHDDAEVTSTASQ